MLDRTRPIYSRISHVSLRLEQCVNGHGLSTATGFVVEIEGRHFLVSNWHVFAGRNAETNECLDKNAALPNEIRVHLHSVGGDEHTRIPVSLPLYADDDHNHPRWLEHPKGREIDIAALEIDLPEGTAVVPITLSEKADLLPLPGLPVAIVGYPLGLANGVWPIWKTGHIASDPNVGYKGLPAFLIDATTRPSMSGSPVFYQTAGPFSYSDGTQVVNAQIRSQFLGVYSGRLHEDSEVGRVWWAEALRELIDVETIGS